jgi:hypothetical protein
MVTPLNIYDWWNTSLNATCCRQRESYFLNFAQTASKTEFAIMGRLLDLEALAKAACHHLRPCEWVSHLQVTPPIASNVRVCCFFNTVLNF